MAENLEELVLRLSADVSGLKAGLDSATAETRKAVSAMTSTMDQLKGSLSESKNAVLGLAAALGVTLSVEAVRAWVTGSMEGILAMDRMATRTGIVADRLYGLKEAGESVGVTLDSVTSGIMRLERAIENNSGKVYEAQGAFKKLGINARELRDLSPDEAFVRIGEAIAKLDTQAEKTKITMELFGRGGMALIPLFEQGGSAIDNATAKMKELGVATGEIDAEKVHRAWEAVDDIKDSLEGMGNKVAVELSGPIEAAAEVMKDFVFNSGGISSITGPAMQALIPVIGALLDSFQGLVLFTQTLILELTMLKAAAEGVAAVMTKKVAIVGAVISHSKELIAADAELNHAESQLIIAMKSGDQERINAAQKEKDAKKEALLLVKESVNEMALAARAGDPLQAKYEATIKGLQDQAEALNKALHGTSLSSEFIAQIGLIEAKIAEFEKGREKKKKEDAEKKKTTGGEGPQAKYDIEDELSKLWVEMHKARLKQDELNENEHYALMEADTKRHFAKQTALLDEQHKAGLVLDQDYLDQQAKNQVDQQAVIADFARKHAAKLEEIRLGITQSDKDGLDAWLANHKGAINQAEANEENDYKKRLQLLKEHLDAKLITEQEYQNALQRLTMEHEIILANTEKTQEQKQADWDKKLWYDKASVYGQALGQMSSLMNSHSRAMFEVGKAAAIANVIVNTAAGVGRAFGEYPFYVALAMSAAIVASGAAQLSTINSTSFGGGGGGGGGGSPALPSAVAAPASTAAQVPNITLSVPDDAILDARGVRKLISLINQALQDGVVMA